MKKSKIVSYTSEELKQMPSESNWDAANAMTDEEILAAIADDPDDAELVEWHPRQTDKPTGESVNIFIAVNDRQGRLTMHRVSKVVADSNRKSGYIFMVDDTGMSYRVLVQATEDVVQGVKQKSE